MGVVLSTAGGNPCSVLSPVPSATLLYCVDVRLMLREWLDALIERDVLSEKSVEMEAMRLLPNRPRASRRIGTSSEASLMGPCANWRIGNPSEALRSGASVREGLGEGALARRRVVATRASGKSENRPRPCDCPLALIFARF